MLPPLSPAAIDLATSAEDVVRSIFEIASSKEHPRNDMLLVFLFYAIVCLTNNLSGSLYLLCPHTIELSL